jgi:hypothetical protein
LPDNLHEDIFIDARKRFEFELGSAFPMNAVNVRGLTQKGLSDRLEKCDYQALLNKSVPADKVRLECVAAEHSSAWLRAVPAVRPFNMVLEPNQATAALKHRLGLHQTDDNSSCASCVKKKLIPEKLDRLGHHALTCKYHGYVQVRHNDLSRTFVKICTRAQLRPKLEQGAEDRDLRRPADVLLPDWNGAVSAALDFTVVSPLTLDNISGAVVAGHRAELAVTSAEQAKHEKYDEKCKDLSWTCIPMAVDTYGVWGNEAREMFGQVGEQLSSQLNMSRSAAVSFIYNVLGVALARKNANALLAKSPVSNFGKSDVVVLGRAGVNNNLDRGNNNVPFSSAVRSRVQADSPVPESVVSVSSAFANRSLVLNSDQSDSVVNNYNSFSYSPSS